MDIIVRLVKPIVMGAVMFGSIHYLTGSAFTAGMLALIPLLLGWLGIFMGPAFGLTGLAFISAIGWAVSPPDLRAAVAGQTAGAAATVKATVEGERSKATEPSVNVAPSDTRKP